MSEAIIRRRNRNNKIRGYTLVELKNGRYYADAKIGGQYYGPMSYVLRGAVEFKTIYELKEFFNIDNNIKVLDPKEF